MTTFLFIISILAINFAWAQPKQKSFQSIKVEKTASGGELIIKPLAGHHFNLEAPTRVKKNGQDVKPLTITPTSLRVPLKTNETCELQIQTYVCDDKKTFCAPQNETLTCASLLKSGAQFESPDLKNEASATAATTATVKKKTEKSEVFIVNDPQMAIEQAKKQGKPLFIDFFGTWCPPCNILDETVFNNARFKNLSKDFILLKLDVDDKVSWDLKSKYAVKGYPTIVLATTDNEEITRFVGTIPEAQIFKLMAYAKKNKTISLKQKMAQYQKKPTPSVALEVIDSLVSNDDFASALAYIPQAMKSTNLKLEEKEMLMLIPFLANAKNETAATAKMNLPMLKILFETYPVSDLYSKKLERLQDVAKMLEDDPLKKWVNETNIKNLDAALAKPELNLKLATKSDLLFLRADSFEKLGQTENEKKAYAELANEYAKLIVKHKQNPETNRGYNLERIYSVYKSGAIEQARTEYEKIISAYPHEFTFHYNYGSVLKDLKEWDKALESANKALQYSYGDNQLRAIYLVSEIESKKGLKNESLDRLTKAIESTELPKDESVRTHRYVKRLAELKKTIQESK